MNFARSGRTFKVVDRFVYSLKGAPTFLHLCSIRSGVREFVLLQDRRTGLVYLNEITTGHLEAVEENSLFEDLGSILAELGFTQFKKDK